MTITLAHGNGGLRMRELVDDIFARRLANPLLNTEQDAASLLLDKQHYAFTTDGFTVQPLFFPGGNIGSLAIHGTVNDLAVSGARPRYLSLNAFIEEGLSIKELTTVVDAMATAARKAEIFIVTGDTKIVPRGHGGGIYFATTGIGERQACFKLGQENIRPGDALLVSGTIGNHGIAVMMARESFGLHCDIVSDSASIWPLVAALQNLANPEAIKCMRDPTRGGLNMVVQDWSRTTGLGINLIDDQLPIQPAVASVCNMLGYDPFNLACEGRIILAAEPSVADTILMAWRDLPEGTGARKIGNFTGDHQQVVLHTDIGGQRILQPLEDEPLPRIC